MRLEERLEDGFWRAVPLMLVLAAGGCATAPKKAGAGGPAYANLIGTYELIPALKPTRGVTARMRVSSQDGREFTVGAADASGDPKRDWSGRGVIDGAEGYYDWAFGDGKKGRTTFRIDSQGRLQGQVRGAGIDWDYIGRRVEGAISLP